MAASDNKSKETRSSFYLCILGDIYKGVDNCRLSIIVDSALVDLFSCFNRLLSKYSKELVEVKLTS